MSPVNPEQQFLQTCLVAIQQQQLERIIFSQYKGSIENLEKMTVRLIELQNVATLNCLYRYKTQDVTKNYPLDQAETLLAELLADCKQANLFSLTGETQLKKK